jgi:hypothetical protein
MWKFLESMPAELSFTIIILGIISIVIISLRGHFKAMFGKKTIELGGDSPNENGRDTSIIIKRSCGDCILMLMGEREKYEMRINQEANKVLKTQMTFAEQKLLEMQSIFMRSIINAIHQHVEKTSGAIDEGIQYKLVYGLFRDATMSIKDELRRSFKDNGFYYLESLNFMDFINNKIANINSVLIQFIRNIFPDRSGVIQSNEIIEAIGKENDYFSKILRDIYSFAQSVKVESDSNIIGIKEEFRNWVDDFSKPKKEIEA